MSVPFPTPDGPVITKTLAMPAILMEAQDPFAPVNPGSGSGAPDTTEAFVGLETRWRP
jgi:hypothetical protein